MIYMELLIILVQCLEVIILLNVKILLIMHGINLMIVESLILNKLIKLLIKVPMSFFIEGENDY
jgi:hypothetical protein